MHGQIVANIENNPNHYERDWTLDDVSQMSFKPCIQGSGSLTPFHDSVNNMYENQVKLNSGESTSQNSSNEHIFNQISDSSSGGGGGGITLKRTNDLRLFKIEPDQMLKYPASAVFLENRDILNDGGPSSYSKLYHRHSAIITAPTNLNENLDKLLGKDVRRYSDTRLSQIASSQKHLDQQHQHQHNQLLPSNQIFNVTNVLGSNIQPIPPLATSNNQSNNQPQVTDIIFERTGGADNGKTNFDPLELNIQEMLELDIQTQKLDKKSRLSLNQNNLGHCINIRDDSYFRSRADGSGGNFEDDVENLGSRSGSGNSRNYTAVTNEKKNIFKSLPNLNASSENLLQ